MARAAENKVTPWERRDSSRQTARSAAHPAERQVETPRPWKTHTSTRAREFSRSHAHSPRAGRPARRFSAASFLKYVSLTNVMTSSTCRPASKANGWQAASNAAHRACCSAGDASLVRAYNSMSLSSSGVIFPRRNAPCPPLPRNPWQEIPRDHQTQARRCKSAWHRG